MDNSVRMEYLWEGDLIDKTKDATKATGKLATAAERAAEALHDKIFEQKLVVKDVEAALKKLQKQYENTAPGKAQNEVLADLKACDLALREEKHRLADLQFENKKAAASVNKLSKEYRALVQEMARMRLAGEKNTEQYRQMANRAAHLYDTLHDVRNEAKALASDDANWEAMASGLNGLSGAVTAGTGIMSLFVGENEELARVQTRLQAVMATTMGIQQVFNALNKDSAFRLKLVTKATNWWTAANNSLAASLGVSAATAKVLMGTMTLGVSVLIGGLIALWYKYSSEAKKAAAVQNETAEA
ncbi:hypothetical protein [Prevotella falsenii]|uniref:hypothetical protein n=1 Tax=Prevotella falsenii TaxID=515414 RepID=UPI00046A6B9D|nr:hypothetical protein [Prevotella falsenii]